MAFDPNKDISEYFQLLSSVRQEQSASITDELCAFTDLLTAKLKRCDFKAVQQGLNGLKLIFETLRPTLDKKDERFEQDHQELLALAAGSNSPFASALILKEISRLDPSGQ